MDWREHFKRQAVALLAALGLIGIASLVYAGLLLLLGRPLW